MILVKYFIAPSQIFKAGKGLFLEEECPKGKVLIIPNEIQCLVSEKEIFQNEHLEASSIRWFEDVFSVDHEWSAESHLNHSFTPNCYWHLGFVFAARNLKKKEELTVDYSLFLGEGRESDFYDSLTQKKVIGLSWKESLKTSLQNLLSL